MPRKGYNGGALDYGIFRQTPTVADPVERQELERLLEQVCVGELDVDTAVKRFKRGQKWPKGGIYEG